MVSLKTGFIEYKSLLQCPWGGTAVHSITVIPHQSQKCELKKEGFVWFFYSRHNVLAVCSNV